MVSIEIKDITSSSFYARVVGMDAGEGLTKSVSWQLNGESQAVDSSDDIADTSSESNWILFNNLDQNTEYEVIASVIYLEGAYWEPDLTEYVTTLEDDSGGGGEDSYIPDVENIYIRQINTSDPATEIAVQARGFDTDYFEANWELTWYIHDPSLSGATLIDIISDEVPAGDSSSSTSIFDGLSPETTYEIELRVRYYVNGGRNTEWFYETFSTESESSSSNRPNKFEWDSPKIKGQPFNITAEEWGNLLDNINAVREYKGYSAISSTSNADAIARFYYPSKGDNFLASMYNQCIYAFEDMELLDYNSYRVLKGDPITADAINFLVETINSVE